MIRTIVIGAAGRMGRLLLKNIFDSTEFKLTAAIEHLGNQYIGQDAAVLTGHKKSGILISDSLVSRIKNADVIIDFSTGPVVENAKTAAKNNVAAVIGTTALSDLDKSILADLVESGGKIVFAPNMSVGVNLLFHIAGKVAEILGNDYDTEIIEMHHNMKKDAPSGTAVKLVEILAEAKELDLEKDICYGRNGITGERKHNEIGVHAIRGGDIVGEHTVIFAANGERIELTHKATRRDTFATGALRAAVFLMTAPPGLYDMQDVLKIKQ